MTAASMAGAWKAHLETLGLGVPVFRDGAPDGVAPPFVVVTEGIGYSDRLRTRGLVVVEAVQVDLYQPSRVPVAGGARVANVESYTLPEQIAAALRGRGIAEHAPWQVYGSTVTGRRWPPADNVVRHTWTATVTRARARKAA